MNGDSAGLSVAYTKATWPRQNFSAQVKFQNQADGLNQWSETSHRLAGGSEGFVMPDLHPGPNRLSISDQQMGGTTVTRQLDLKEGEVTHLVLDLIQK